MLDVDGFAIESSKRTLARNGMQAEVIAGAGMRMRRVNCAIITNPPFHKGVHTCYQATEDLLRRLPTIAPGGELRLVANNFLRYPELISTCWALPGASRA